MAFEVDVIPQNTKIPGIYLGYDTRNAIQGVQISDKICCFIGQKGMMPNSISAPAEYNKVYDVMSEQQAISLFGAGSNLHLQIRSALKTFQAKNYVAIALDDSDTGVSAASGKIKISGAATTGGTLTVSIGGETAQIAISVGDDAEKVANRLNVELQKRTLSVLINAESAGELLLTAISKGAGGNTISIGFLQSDAAGVSISVTKMSGGVDVGIDFESVFKELEGQKIDIVSFPYETRGKTPAPASKTALVNYLELVSNPIEQKPAIAVSGFIGNLTAIDAIFPDVQNPRIVFVNAKNCVETIYQLTGAVAAMLKSTPNPAIPFDNVVLPLNSTGQGYLRSEIESLISKGVTVLDVEQTGALSVVRLISTDTESEVSQILPDLWIRSLDFVREAVRNDIKVCFDRQKLTATSIARVRSVIFGTLKKLEAADIEVVKNVDAHANNLIVEPAPDNIGFLRCRIPSDIVVGLHGMTGFVDLIIS